MHCVFYVTDAADSRRCPIGLEEITHSGNETAVRKCPCSSGNPNAPLCTFPRTRVHSTIKDVATFRDAYLLDLTLPPSQSRYNPMTTAAMEAPPVPATSPGSADSNGSINGDDAMQGRTLNGLTLYERLPNAMDAIKYLGGAIATSKMFGCPSDQTGIAQGVVIATTCLAERITPLDFRRRYHVIGGTVCMQANAMLAEFVRRGGEYEIVHATPDRAEVVLRKGNKSFASSLTFDEACGEPWPWNKDATEGKIAKRTPDGKVNTRGLKTNWATPRARANMLWARAISEGVRRFDCTVNHGVYTPEEVSDYTGIAYVPPESPPAPVVPVAAKADPVIDAEYAPATAAQPPATTPPATKPAGISPDQIERLKTLKAESGVTTETWKEWLGKCNVDSATKLTTLQASDCEEWLKRMVAAKASKPPEAAPAVHAAPPAESTPQGIRPDQVETLKKLKAEFAISGESWKAYLAEYGVTSAANLRMVQASLFEGKVRFAEENKRKKAAAPPAPSPAEDPPFDTNAATSPPEPVSQDQLSKLKSLVTELQVDVPTWKAKLAEFGVDTAKALNANQAEAVITDLEKIREQRGKRDELSAWADSATTRGN